MVISIYIYHIIWLMTTQFRNISRSLDNVGSMILYDYLSLFRTKLLDSFDRTLNNYKIYVDNLE